MHALRQFALVACALVTLLAATSVLAQRDSVLVLGVIHDQPRQIHDALSPMADYVAQQLKDHGIDDVLIVTAKDRRQLMEMLRHERVDWVTETAYNAIALERSGLAQIIARTWRNGSPTYRTMLFVRDDSPIESLLDLRDQTVAFQHALSTSAFFVPAVELMRESLPLCAIADPRDSRPDGCVAFTFTNNNFNTAAWVHKNIVQVGAYSNLDWQSANNVPAQFKRDFRVLHESDAIPRGLELVRSTLDDTLKAALRDIFFAMHDDPLATQAMQEFYATRKFDELSVGEKNLIEQLKAALPDFEKLSY